MSEEREPEAKTVWPQWLGVPGDRRLLLWSSRYGESDKWPVPQIRRVQIQVHRASDRPSETL